MERGTRQRRISPSPCFNSLRTGRGMERSQTPPDRSNQNESFNSLRTGRGMESVGGVNIVAIVTVVFQFPTNGKGHGKEKKRVLRLTTYSVSIPYEREGAWKAVLSRSLNGSRLFLFQFPTNGKGHGKFLQCRMDRMTLVCFNSLRTGRGMESK